MHASVAAISSPHAVTMLRTDYHYITASALPHLSCLADAEQPGGWFIAAWEGKKLAFFLFLAARTGFHSVQCASLFFFLLPFDGVLYQLRMYEYLAHVSYTYTECMLCKSPATYTPPFFPVYSIFFFYFLPLHNFLHHSPRSHPHHQQEALESFPRPAINARVLAIWGVKWPSVQFG